MNNRIFKKIRDRYEHFFRVSPKVNSSQGKYSKLIKEDLYTEYFQTVLADPEIDMETKKLVALLTTGLRITEVMHIKVNQLNLEALRVERVLILKKRKQDLRLTKPLHPVVVEFLRTAVNNKSGDDFILEFPNRHQPFRRLNRYFGTGCHDYRHSFVSYFLKKNKNQGLEKITAIQGWSNVAMAYNYANVDTTAEVDNFFKEAA
jgi:integrase